MPPRSPERSTFAEEGLARRISAERERRGWSPAGLASRMTKAGCPMTQSGIWKIENPDPKTGRRRRITFDEAVTLARVFEMPIEELALPPEVVKSEEAAGHVRAIIDLIAKLEEVDEELAFRWRRLIDLAEGDVATGLVANAVRRVVGGDDQPWWGLSPDERRELANRPDLTPLELVDAWLKAALERRNEVFRKQGSRSTRPREVR